MGNWEGRNRMIFGVLSLKYNMLLFVDPGILQNGCKFSCSRIYPRVHNFIKPIDQGSAPPLHICEVVLSPAMAVVPKKRVVGIKTETVLQSLIPSEKDG